MLRLPQMGRMIVWGFVVVLLSACGGQHASQDEETGTEQNTTVSTDTQVGTGEINSTTSAESNETASEEQNTTASTDDTGTNTNEANTAATNESNGTVTNVNGATEQNTTTSTNDDTGASTGETNSTASAESNETAQGEENTTTPAQNDTNTTTAETNTSTQTEAPVLQSLKLTVAKTSLNKDGNTSVKAEATYTDNSTKDVTAKVQWVATPSSAVKVSNSTLTALQDKPTTLSATIDGIRSNAVQLDIMWTVNGHTLPPEPDPKVNDSTLLGIDVNNNGVRDDVERKIYATYKKAIERAVMMQAFRVEQKMLADHDLVKNAREWAKNEDRSLNCRRYLYLYKKQKRIPKMAQTVDVWQYNTEDRVKIYFNFDRALSGGVYSLGNPTSNDCKFDVEKVLEMDR